METKKDCRIELDMKRTNIILINPRSKDERRNSLPLGLLYILRNLREHGFNVYLYDLHNGIGSEDELFLRIAQEDISLIGVSVCTAVYYSVLNMCARIKYISPDTYMSRVSKVHFLRFSPAIQKENQKD